MQNCKESNRRICSDFQLKLRITIMNEFIEAQDGILLHCVVVRS